MRDKFKASKYTDEEIEWVLENAEREITWNKLASEFNKKFKKTKTGNALRKMYNSYEDFADSGIEEEFIEKKMPKVLIFDIETAPIIAHLWSIYQDGVSLNQVVKDWHVLSWAAKWLGAPEDEVMYEDQRNVKNIEDDAKMLQKIWELLNEADIVITQNGKKFDVKKLNARFILNGFQPPTPFRHIDTLLLARRHFGFTSNKLEYLTEKLCVKYKKLKHKRFPGHELWRKVMSNDSKKEKLEAWEEMRLYNMFDVLSLEELYTKLIPWDNSIDFDSYHDSLDITCTCGSTTFVDAGYHHTNLGRYQRYQCTKCGKVHRDGVNLLPKEKRAKAKRKAGR